MVYLHSCHPNKIRTLVMGNDWNCNVWEQLYIRTLVRGSDWNCNVSEKMYTCTRCVMGSSVDFEILDTAGQVRMNREF